jgi:hypothetical protein
MKRRAFDRREWERRMRAFNDEVHGGVEYFIISNDELHEAIFAAANKDDFAATVVLFIRGWLKEASQAEPGSGALCVNCDTEFRVPVLLSSPSAPAGYLVVMPFANDRTAMITGVCQQCFAREDLDDRIVEKLREMWPSGYRAQASRLRRQ